MSRNRWIAIGALIPIIAVVELMYWMDNGRLALLALNIWLAYVLTLVAYWLVQGFKLVRRKFYG